MSFHFGSGTSGIGNVATENEGNRVKIYHIAGKDVWVPVGAGTHHHQGAKYIE